MHNTDSKNNYDIDTGSATRRTQSGGNVSMPPELFEKLYLQPQHPVSGDLRTRFGNPTPLGLTGFVLGLTPMSCCLMGWRGSGGFGSADIGVYFFIGGPLLMTAGILEFFLGNTFPFIVFMTYGGTFMAYAATLSPWIGSATIYSSDQNFYSGMETSGFYSSLAFLPLCIATLHVLFMLASLRINGVFFGIFTCAAIGFYLFAAALWKDAEGSTTGATLQVAAGAFLFITSLQGWYLLVIQICASTGFPMPLPVGDFTRFWGKNNKIGEREDAGGETDARSQSTNSSHSA